MSKMNPVFYPLHIAIGALSGRTLLHSWQKGTTLHSACSGAHKIWYYLSNFGGLGNSITCGQMECFLTKHSWYATSTNPHPHLYSPLPTLINNPFTNSEMRLEDISLFHPTTKLSLSGSLAYPSLEWQLSFYMNVNMCGLKQGSYCSLAANKKIT